MYVVDLTNMSVECSKRPREEEFDCIPLYTKHPKVEHDPNGGKYGKAYPAYSLCERVRIRVRSKPYASAYNAKEDDPVHDGYVADAETEEDTVPHAPKKLLMIKDKEPDDLLPDPFSHCIQAYFDACVRRKQDECPSDSEESLSSDEEQETRFFF